MADLTNAAIGAWLAKLPEAVRASIGEDPGSGAVGDDRIADLTARLGTAGPTGAPEVVAQNAALCREMGRARRLRLLAWAAKRTLPDSGAVLRRIVGDGGEDSGQGGSPSEVAPFFLEDLRAFVAALGPRAAALALDESLVASVRSAALELESEAELKQEVRQ